MTKEIDKIAFIYLNQGKILSTRSKGKSKYYIPGGKREHSETDQETLIREIKEELNVEINSESISKVGVFKAQADSHSDGVIVKMTCYKAEFSGELKPDHEIAEIVWLNFKDIEKVSAVDKIIFQYLREKGELE